MTRLFQILALSTGLLSLHAPAIAQGRESRPPDTDKTVPVTRGSRLSVVNDAGEVVIKSWNQDSLRVQARHSSRVSVEIQTANNIVNVRKRTTGPSQTVDYEISAPAWISFSCALSIVAPASESAGIRRFAVPSRKGM